MFYWPLSDPKKNFVFTDQEIKALYKTHNIKDMSDEEGRGYVNGYIAGLEKNLSKDEVKTS